MKKQIQINDGNDQKYLVDDIELKNDQSTSPDQPIEESNKEKKNTLEYFTE